MDNPYEYIKSKIENRPFNKEGKKDGNHNYIHNVDIFKLADRILELEQEVIDQDSKCIEVKAGLADRILELEQAAETQKAKNKTLIHELNNIAAIVYGHADLGINKTELADKCLETINSTRDRYLKAIEYIKEGIE